MSRSVCLLLLMLLCMSCLSCRTGIMRPYGKHIQVPIKYKQQLIGKWYLAEGQQHMCRLFECSLTAEGALLCRYHNKQVTAIFTRYQGKQYLFLPWLEGEEEHFYLVQIEHIDAHKLSLKVINAQKFRRSLSQHERFWGDAQTFFDHLKQNPEVFTEQLHYQRQSTTSKIDKKKAEDYQQSVPTEKQKSAP